jgi:hypothetical protein
MNNTLNICAKCDQPYILEEVKEFVVHINLPLEGEKSADKHKKELCIYCLRDTITRETGIPFVTVYEVILQEKIMVWTDQEFNP